MSVSRHLLSEYCKTDGSSSCYSPRMNRFHRWFCGSAAWRRTLERRLVPWTLRGLDLGQNLLEVGPGPGRATEVLRHRAARLTSIEIDAQLARCLSRRIRAANVAVVEGDGTAMPFADRAFSGVVCFTMLHHVPSRALQDCLLREVRRVLAPGGWFAGSDSTSSRIFRLAHLFDTMVLVEPSDFGERLARAGFEAIDVRMGNGAFRFRARRAHEDSTTGVCPV